MEANTREAENIDAIDLLASTMASDRDTYANLSRTFTYLMAELVLAKKKPGGRPEGKQPPVAGHWTVLEKHKKRRRDREEGRSLPTEKGASLLLVMRI